ncbi:unnamed protein product [Fraxinus pennsylvanica]|uniref:FAR1 domain-containing protein n=1 Tax=Fraxinus pennsylvanica TaxID=56036 RepID=A0AAD1Z613_9LAMI|nr:unnamed protein product [Fraxinus pennsylvanica]
MDLVRLDLENEDMEFDVGSGEEEETGYVLGQQFQYDDNCNGNALVEGARTSLSSSNGNDGDFHLEPYEGMEFDSEQAGRIFYNSYARRVGFSTRVSVYQRSRRDGSIICRQVVCSREGFRREGSENKSKRQHTVTRSNLGLENNPQESFTARYDILSKEAIKYVEDGADSVHVYHVAMNALREAARQVAAAKQDTPSVVQSTQIIKCNQGIDVNETQSDPSNQEKKIQELTAELENASQICEAYQAKLLLVLREMEEQKLKISVKVQSVRVNLQT